MKTTSQGPLPSCHLHIQYPMLNWTGHHQDNHRSQACSQNGSCRCFSRHYSSDCCYFPHLLCCLQIYLGFISVMRKGRYGSIGAFFLWLGFFCHFKWRFPVFKYMCAHITVPMDDCRWHNSCFILSTLRSLSWTGLQQELSHWKSR